MATAIAPFESALEEIVRERRELDAAEAAWLAKVADYAVSGGWAADNYLSAAAAIGDHCHLTRAAASRGRSPRREAVAAARARRRVRGRRHIPRRMSKSSPGPTPATARRSSISTERRAHRCWRSTRPRRSRTKRSHRITDAIDGDGGAANDDDIYEKRNLHSSRTMDGVRGVVVPRPRRRRDRQRRPRRPNGNRPRSLDDPRTPAQRRADALVDICRFSLTFGEHPPSATKRRRGVPNVLAVVDIRMFERTAAEFVADIRAEYATGGTLSQATIERLLCDCDISRVIMDGPSEVLDLGRTTRTPSDKQFKALVVRDGHCQAKGCKVPWQFCQPHHIQWWTHGGPTDLDNLKLLCWHHHRQAHKHDAQPRPG